MQMAEVNLQFIGSQQSAAEGLSWMREMRFDVAPLDEEPPHRYVSSADLEAGVGTVGDLAKPVDARFLVSDELGLADAITRLGGQPYYFVLGQSRLGGIVTRADLQRPAVTVVTLGLILVTEAGLNRIIERRLPGWREELNADELAKMEDVFEARRSENAEIGRLDCLMLPQRMKLLRKCPGVVEELGFQNKGVFHKWKERLGNMRDVLAHGGGLLSYQSDPEAAIDIFQEVRSFAGGVWRIVRES